MCLHLPFKENPKLFADVLGFKEVVNTIDEVSMKSSENKMVFLKEENVILSSVEFLSKQSFNTIDPVSTKLKTL